MNLEHQGIIKEKRGEGNVGAAANDASSSQVLHHQLIFHIMYGLGQFYHRQNKGEERRGEGRFGKKKQQLLCKHRATADGKNSQKNSSGPLVLCPQAAAMLRLSKKEKTIRLDEI